MLLGHALPLTHCPTAAMVCADQLVLTSLLCSLHLRTFLAYLRADNLCAAQSCALRAFRCV